MPRFVREDASPDTVAVKLVGGEVSVDKLDDLFVGHAGALLSPKGDLLFATPGIHIRQIIGINVDKGVEEGSEGIVAAEVVIDEQEILKGVLTEGQAFALPAGADGVLGEGAKTDAPALEDDGLDGGLAGAVDGEPLALGTAVSAAGEGSLVEGRHGRFAAV